MKDFEKLTEKEFKALSKKQLRTELKRYLAVGEVLLSQKESLENEFKDELLKKSDKLISVLEKYKKLQAENEFNKENCNLLEQTLNTISAKRKKIELSNEIIEEISV